MKYKVTYWDRWGGPDRGDVIYKKFYFKKMNLWVALKIAVLAFLHDELFIEEVKNESQM